MTYLKHIILARTVGLLANIQILVPIFARLAFLRVLILTLALSTLTFGSAHAGGQGSGGGDPLIRYAVPYPDTDKLQQALQLVEMQILKSGYPDDFKGQLVVEMNDLLKAEKYKLVPAIILPPGFWPESYDTPTDIDSFLDLGGMTATSKGANIYFTERVRQYSNEQLSALLLHELIHHCVTYGLSTDEKFVEDLTSSIMSGVRTHKLDLAFETKTYFRKDFISRDQFLDAIGFDLFLNIHNVKTPQVSSALGGAIYVTTSKTLELLKSLPKNLVSHEFREFYYEKFADSVSDYRESIMWANTMEYYSAELKKKFGEEYFNESKLIKLLNKLNPGFINKSATKYNLKKDTLLYWECKDITENSTLFSFIGLEKFGYFDCGSYFYLDEILL
ncbi:MAG: hypothetical protein ABL927_08150 [Bdellovibrionales bacterium]